MLISFTLVVACLLAGVTNASSWQSDETLAAGKRALCLWKQSFDRNGLDKRPSAGQLTRFVKTETELTLNFVACRWILSQNWTDEEIRSAGSIAEPQPSRRTRPVLPGSIQTSSPVVEEMKTESPRSLPDGWVEYTQDGRTAYWHAATENAQWDRPARGTDVDAQAEPEVEETENTDIPENCLVCYSLIQPPTTKVDLGCEHIICLVCFRGTITARGTTAGDITCVEPDCDYKMSNNEIRKAMDSKDFQRYDALQAEKAVEGELARCPRHCGWACIPEDDVSGDRYVECQNNEYGCDCVFCLRCQAEWTNARGESHTGRTCEEYARIANVGRMTAEQQRNVRLNEETVAAISTGCPKCGRQIERTWGCNHMTCGDDPINPTNGCGFEFCYTCAGPHEQNGCDSFHCQYRAVDYVHEPVADSPEAPRPPPPRPETPVANDQVNAAMDSEPTGPGLYVANAGDDDVNGWYARKNAVEGPPAASPFYRILRDPLEDWTFYNEGRHWYEKNDGCFIYRIAGRWHMYDRNGFYRYISLGCGECNGTGRVPGQFYGTNPCRACNGAGVLSLPSPPAEWELPSSNTTRSQTQDGRVITRDPPANPPPSVRVVA